MRNNKGAVLSVATVGCMCLVTIFLSKTTSKIDIDDDTMLMERVIRVCPHCTTTSPEKSHREMNQIFPGENKPRLSQLTLDNIPGVIQQLPYKISGDIEVPTGQQSYTSVNPAVTIRFAQVIY
jgi:hypothetical protein